MSPVYLCGSTLDSVWNFQLEKHLSDIWPYGKREHRTSVLYSGTHCNASAVRLGNLGGFYPYLSCNHRPCHSGLDLSDGAWELDFFRGHHEQYGDNGRKNMLGVFGNLGYDNSAEPDYCGAVRGKEKIEQVLLGFICFSLVRMCPDQAEFA